MQKVLVSGSAGFIGGYVVEELLRRGYAVVGLDNFSKYGKVCKSYDDDPDYLRALLDDSITASNRITDQVLADGGLDRRSVRASRRDQRHFTLRWILVHMIEEYARHNGHADLIRELTDGAVGW